jgi:hypothetical protein
VRKMINMSHSYFHDVWSKGDITLCDNILDDEFVHKENIWHPNRLIVGPHAFKRFVEECRTVYPDLNIEVQQVSAGRLPHSCTTLSVACAALSHTACIYA